MGNGKLRLSALGCLGGKATEFSRRIAWARSRCHTLNIWGSWFFLLAHSVPLSHICSSLTLGAAVRECQGCLMSLCVVMFHHHLWPGPSPKVPWGPARGFHRPCGVRAGPACPVGSMCQRVGSALFSSYVENNCFSLLWSFKNRNFQIF